MSKAACKNCGREVGWMNLASGGLCQDCVKLKTAEEHEELVRRLGAPPLHCQLTLTEVAAQFRPLNLEIGDLFASQNDLVYLTTAGCVYTGKLAGIGFLVGGLGLGIAASVENIKNVGAAQLHAKQVRAQDFGMSIEDRVRRHAATIIPKAEIQSIAASADGKTLRIVHTGGHLDLGYDASTAAAKKLQAWLQSEPLDEPDTEGANLRLPPAEILVSWLVDGSIGQHVAEPTLVDLLTRRAYMDALLGLFEKLKYPQKEALVKTVLCLPDAWPGEFKKYFVKLIRSDQGTFRWVLVFVFLGLLCAFCFLFNFSALVHEMPFLAVLLGIGIFSLFITIPFLFITPAAIRTRTRLLSLFPTPRQPQPAVPEPKKAAEPAEEMDKR